LATLQASLVSKAKTANKFNRLHFVHDIVNVTSNSEDKTVQTFSTGSQSVVREGRYNWTLQFVKGGLSLSNELAKFNGNGTYSVYFYDTNFVLYGYKTATGLAAIPTDYIWCNKMTPNTGSETSVYSINVVFDPAYINDANLIGFAQATSAIKDVKGLKNINVKLNSWVESTGVVNISLLEDLGFNVGELYNNELDVAGAYVANNKATGAAITISTVAYVPSTKTFNVTLDTADVDFPAAAQGILFNVGTIATLEGLLVFGYESAGAITLPTT
jgi:hypothetical protein